MSKCRTCGGTFEEEQITYPQKFGDNIAILENVPAEVCKQCGDELFHVDVVKKIEQLLWSGTAPVRIAHIPVYSLAEGQSVEASEVSLDWSPEYPFSTESIKNYVTNTSGVYEILQRNPYARYRGTTRILKIGMSKEDLQHELTNHERRHTAANRLARVRGQAGLNISFKYSVVEAEGAADAEKALLKEFEDRHWDLPVLNSQRGYGRGEDRHYKVQ